MHEIKLSAVIITYNEEKNIGRCLDSLQGLADEIIVVDSFSTDETEDICNRRNVQFITNPFKGHIEQKNFATGKASNDYILSLDADEVISDELRSSIIEVKSTWAKDGYTINRLTSYCGKWIYHTGWYPDAKLRLWDRRKGKWGGENPHDKVIMAPGSDIGHIKGDILHYSFDRIYDHVITANNFSDIAAQEWIKKGKKVNIFYHIILNPIYTFIYKYILRLGFLDGIRGFVISILSATSNFLKYTKIWFYSKEK